ncbi:MAG TPA: TolC family protein [Bryobacteraceae bacterium]|jgi:outer membrane protein TolC|nr:TolC family protein [Bryobacteraceae bacterium]
MLFRTLFTGILLTAGAFAQMSSFPKPNYFRETFQKTQTKVELRDPVKLKDFVVDGKLELSLKHYLELVMANNTDVAIQLLSLEVPKNAIQMAFGAWDPLARASFSTTRSTSLPSSALDARTTGVSKALVQPYSLSVSQTLESGTNYSVTFSGAKNSQSNGFNFYNPSLTSGLNFSVTQPLIRNRGVYVNKIPLMSAQSSYKISEFNLTSQVLGLVNTAENAYWSVISARETLLVQEKARDVAAEYLKYMQQQLDLGALSPLDIFNPKQRLAAAEVAVSQAKFNLAQAEDVLRHQLGADLDPQVRVLPVVLTEPVDPGPAEAITKDREQEVQKALNLNPAIKASLQKLDVDDLSIQSARNGLLPNLSFNAQYTANGRGGIYYPSSSSLVGSGGGSIEPIPGGIADALGQMFGFGYPTYQAGLVLTLPIRSRVASATMANAVVQKKSDALALRNAQQNIRLNILNAVTALEGAKEQLKLAIVQKDFAAKNLDAEDQKYKLGTETNQNVLQAQQDLATAELTVVNSQIAVRTRLLNLLTQTGELLDERGIVVR